MSVYLDASALAKRYTTAELDRDAAERILLDDPAWVTARHTYVELHSAISRSVGERELGAALGLFHDDWMRVAIVELDAELCVAAGSIATSLGVKALDALHLAAAERAGGVALPFVTFDRKQGHAARQLGFTVFGV